MPIDGISSKFRAPRLAKIRLGYKPVGKSYPKDTDVFVARKEDGVTAAMLDAYQATRIEGAEGETYSLGKSLRMLTYFEWDQVDPTGKEIVLGLLNRAWTHGSLHCSGTGGDNPGIAFCRDETFKDAIAKFTKTQARPHDDGWDVECRGPKCPFWHTNNKDNPKATCHREMRFLAQLLDPTVDPEAPNYLKNLGSVEVVSGSYNGMIDVQSGLQLLRSVAGRSFNVPFNLTRQPHTLLVDGKRVVKATLAVTFDNDEAIRFGYSDPKLSTVRPAIRKQLMAQRREQLELARMEIDYDSAKDIVPQLEGPKLGEEGRADYPSVGSPTGNGGKADSASGADSVPSSAAPDPTRAVTNDRDQVVGEAAKDAPRALSTSGLNRLLSRDERNELKVKTGGTPGKPESLTKLRELMRRAFEHFGEPEGDLASLRMRHAMWIRETFEAERP